MKPEKVNICGIEYKIEYCENAADVDTLKRRTLWGQMDHWRSVMTVYDNGQSDGEVFSTIIHEVLHGIEEAVNLTCFKDDKGKELKELDTLATALADVLVRNGWLNMEGKR